MLKQLMKEYMIGFKKVQQADMKNPFVWFPISYGALLPFIISKKEGAIVFISLLPLTLIMLSAHMHPFGLNKMHYLCPMTAEERKKKIRQEYYFRCGLHFTMIAVFLLAVLIIRGIHLPALIYLLAIGFLYSCISNPGECKGKIAYYAFEILAFFVTWICTLTLPGDRPYEKSDYIYLACVYALLLLGMIPAFVSLMKSVRKEIEQNSSFRESEQEEIRA